MSMVFLKLELTANTCVDLTFIEYERPVDLEISMVKMPKDENLNFLVSVSTLVSLFLCHCFVNGFRGLTVTMPSHRY